MPQILVVADAPAADGEPPVMLRERITVGDFESGHFAGQLVERLGWAVGDADEHDRHAHRVAHRQEDHERVVAAAQRELRARAASQRRSVRLVTTAS